MNRNVGVEDVRLKLEYANGYRRGRRDGLELAVKLIVRFAFNCGDNRKLLDDRGLFQVALRLQQEAIK